MKYNNPLIKVTWQDTPENFTDEKIKRIKSYFQEKYNTKFVQVITKTTNYDKVTKLKSIDISDNISEVNYQKKLMKDFVDENKIIVDWEKLNRLDNKINEKILLENNNKVKYNKWFIKKIEFSNFLSFGNNNVIDFTTFNGLSVVESTPKNFGGKSTATVDLLLFLFFNSTTKTKTNIEIFNKFNDSCDEVVVKGFITIDNEEYIIERKLTRKKSKSGEYNVTTKLEFYKLKSDDTIENLNGEQRRETEAFISSAIGSEEDFLTTILTTGSNLEQLIESKPTARGMILTKFLGLDNLKNKEEVAKEIYNEWSKKLISNTNNIVSLENEISENTKLLETYYDDQITFRNNLQDYEKELKTIQEKKDILQLKRNNDVFDTLTKVNPTLLKQEITQLENQIKKLHETTKEVIVVEPKEYYVEETYDEKREKYENMCYAKTATIHEIQDTENKIKKLQNNTVCPTCNRKLDGIDPTEEINKLQKEIEDLKTFDYDKNIKLLLEDLNKYKKLKKQFDNYEKNKILKARYELELEQLKLRIDKKKIELEDYNKNEKKLDENKKIDSELITIKTQIERINGDIKIVNGNIEKIKQKIFQLEERNKTANELIKKIKVEEDTINIFKIYFTIFGKNGISKMIMKNMIPVLNMELYRLLVDSCHFILELMINDKNEIEFIMIDTETRVIKPLSSGSGYERTISSLALRSVLTKISSLPKPNVVVMDEVFGKIADENLEMVGEFFKKIKSYFEHILLISHNPLIRNWTDNLIMIKKEENISSIDFINNKN